MNTWVLWFSFPLETEKKQEIQFHGGKQDKEKRRRDPISCYRHLIDCLVVVLYFEIGVGVGPFHPSSTHSSFILIPILFLSPKFNSHDHLILLLDSQYNSFKGFSGALYEAVVVMNNHKAFKIIRTLNLSQKMEKNH